MNKYRLINSLGFRTSTKYVVIQSDDWGSIRMPSIKTRERLAKIKGINVESPYSYYDTLCSSEDLDALFSVLTKFKDSEGSHPVVTANVVMSNPDFTRMRVDAYSSYYRESVSTTFHRLGLEASLEMWKQGADNGIFDFQFHGREHVNVPLWMKALQDGPSAVKLAAENEVFGVDFQGLNLRKNNFQAAWDYHCVQDKMQILDGIKEGIGEFQDFFQRDSLSVIAPSYTWSPGIEDELVKLGVRDMQGIMFQKVPVIGRSEYKKKFRWTTTERRNHLGYQMRNAFFEPSLCNHSNKVGQVLYRMEQAFRMKKPAIICSHRINFSGGLYEPNRTESLKQLEELLKKALDKWPDIKFIGSSALTRLKLNYDNY